ncbi:endoplasmic reticulum membrane sensor NFE2L1-like [Lampris incognitus]|uniref:endoplasmic reticulum membrane sensor NFE2L1-like n=1 Tax=Lampris incognitus TaxID=2546036 RepID=UPI0024B4BA22|nr:endoplasmic reticulum membrane sensor NFE2L1-like [Lampris incognitus]
MFYLKKYFTEGLIQVAILLSLCGVRVDLGLDPHLPQSWQDRVLGPTSALTQTQFHNLRNRLDHSYRPSAKTSELDAFFTTRRLLGGLRSLDRLQIPDAELETWLVQREADGIPIGPSGPSDQQRHLTGMDRDPAEPGLSTEDDGERRLPLSHPPNQEERHEPQHQAIALHTEGEEEDMEEEKEQEEESARISWSEGERRDGGRRGEGDEVVWRTEGGGYDHVSERELVPNEAAQLGEVVQVGGTTTRPHVMEDANCLGPDREPFLSGQTSLDLELHWQDLLDLMDPQDMDVTPAAVSLSPGNRHRDNTLDAEAFGSFQDSSSEVSLRHVSNNNNDQPASPEAQQDFTLKEADLVQGFLGPLSQIEPQAALLPLMPSAELSIHRPDSNSLHGCQSPRVHTINLLAADRSLDFSLGRDTENEADPFSLNMLTPHPADNTTPSTPSQLRLLPSGAPSVSAPTPPQLQADLSASLPYLFLVDEDEVEEEDGNEGGVPSPLSDLLEDDAMLEEINLFNLALEEGFSLEMGARLEEEEEEADTDSGLSLDFSHSPASPCTSETSSSSSSSVSSLGSLFPQEEEDEDMEGAVTMKHEEQEEQEEVMGAVGGNHPADVRQIYRAPRAINYLPWQEHIGHNHTYNQPWCSSCPPLGETQNNLSKSPQQHSRAKPYQRSPSKYISEAKLWNRDERRACSMKIPFSIELIVNLPVEEFNELLASRRLTEAQLTLIKDIRRRGKNKMAAQNCRRRKMDVLLGLEGDVSRLRHCRLQLLQERQEVLTSLKEMKHHLDILYQEVFSSLREEEGRGADTAQECGLQLGANGSITLTSRRQGAALPRSNGKTNKKPRDKKK